MSRLRIQPPSHLAAGSSPSNAQGAERTAVVLLLMLQQHALAPFIYKLAHGVIPLPRLEPTALGAHRRARERAAVAQVHSMGKGWGPLGCTNIFCIEPDEVDTTYFYILVTVSFINCLVALATVYLV